MHHKELSELATILRCNGDQLLDSTSKLSLSVSLLSKINESFASIISNDVFTAPFHVLSSSNNFIDLNFIFDFMQKTLALKIFPDYNIFNDDFLDLRLFHNLRLLEVHRLSLNVVKGLKSLRSQLEYMTCLRSVDALGDVLENCGADKTQGYIWSHLKSAVFSHNNLKSVDGSFEFTPCLQSLDLSFNYIKNVDVLNCLSNLQYLNLANNNIDRLPLFSGALTEHLRVLILRNNLIDEIKEVGVFTNLEQLDLSSNCIMNYEDLSPLGNLLNLTWLSLKENPLNYHSSYRLKISQYLNENIQKSFVLDDKCLSSKEVRAAASSKFNEINLIRSDSFNSITTASTVVQLGSKNVNQTSDMELSSSSIEIAQPSEPTDNSTDEQPELEEQMMQDSGFGAGPPRPSSPSESIGSATSLHDNDSVHRIKCSESDIEILSNPSQSSIEVLSTTRTSRSTIIANVIKDVRSDQDLQKNNDQAHRSL